MKEEHERFNERLIEVFDKAVPGQMTFNQIMETIESEILSDEVFQSIPEEFRALVEQLIKNPATIITKLMDYGLEADGKISRDFTYDELCAADESESDRSGFLYPNSDKWYYLS